jgi:hypothetical protein
MRGTPISWVIRAACSAELGHLLRHGPCAAMRVYGSTPPRWLSRNTKISWNHFRTVSSHEIPQKVIMKTLMQIWWKCCFHEGVRHELPPRKIIYGGELSWKWYFRVSIIVRVNVWRCTFMHYFRESKTIFRNVFCTITKSLDSGSVVMATGEDQMDNRWRY